MLLMAVTSRPPWRRISNLRFFMFGNVALDEDVCDCGVGDGLLLLSLSLSTKSIISEIAVGNRSIDLLLFPRIGVIVVVFDPAKYGIFSFSFGFMAETVTLPSDVGAAVCVDDARRLPFQSFDRSDLTRT